MPSLLETQERTAAAELQDLVDKGATLAAADDFDPTAPGYVAFRETFDKAQRRHAEIRAILNAGQAAETRPTRGGDTRRSDMGRVLREYDRGNSPKFDVVYDLRELQTGDPYFTPNPTRISVATPAFLTPSLDLVRQVAVGSNAYDFTVPPPVEMAGTVAEGAKKPTIDWVSTPVNGTLETDAVIIDVTRQTLEDDASAERTLRAWLVDAVRNRQNAKCTAAITGATGTLTATGASVAEGLRNGKAELSEVGAAATAAYLNPADAAELDLGAYTANGDVSGYSTVWGMRVVESTAIAVGAPVVGAMSTAVYFLYRNAISTYLTDSGTTDEVTPRDRFSHNLIGILAEGRSRAHVVYPQALCKVTVTTTP